MAQFIDYASINEEDLLEVPDHEPSDLLILFRKQIVSPIAELQGWENQRYTDSNGKEYMLSWTLDRIGNISEIDQNSAVSVLLIYRGATVGNIALSDNSVNDTANNDYKGPVTSSASPIAATSPPGPSTFLYYTSVTSGTLISSVSGPVVTRYNQSDNIKEDYTPKGDLKAVDTGTAYAVCPPVVITYGGAIGVFNLTVELVHGQGKLLTTKSAARSAVTSCAGSIEIIDGTLISTNDLENAKDLIDAVGSDRSDPIADEYEGYIAAGNNTRGTTGIQDPLPKQTSLPTPSPKPAAETNTMPPPARATVPVGCTAWDGTNYDVPMSKNFILRNFTIGYTDKSLNQTRGCLFPNKLVDLPGYSAQTRFCNLQALAQRVLEPLWEQFGSFRINSAIRNQNSVSNGVSQHVTGEAVDIQFPGWSYDMYWKNAQWVKDNIPFDQFIYEHSSKTGSVWFHLSFRQSGNRPVTDRTKVMTMYRGHYDSGLKRYG